MRVAAARAAEKYAVEFAAFTHVGDGVWDVKAARELGWSFIGIAAGEDAERLRCAGAVNIIADYEPVSGLLSMLRTPQRKVKTAKGQMKDSRRGERRERGPGVPSLR